MGIVMGIFMIIFNENFDWSLNGNFYGNFYWIFDGIFDENFNGDFYENVFRKFLKDLWWELGLKLLWDFLWEFSLDFYVYFYGNFNENFNGNFDGNFAGNFNENFNGNFVGMMGILMEILIEIWWEFWWEFDGNFYDGFNGMALWQFWLSLVSYNYNKNVRSSLQSNYSVNQNWTKFCPFCWYILIMINVKSIYYSQEITMTPTQNTFGPLNSFWALLILTPISTAIKRFRIKTKHITFRCPQIQACVKMGMTPKLNTSIPFGPPLPSANTRRL